MVPSGIWGPGYLIVGSSASTLITGLNQALRIAVPMRCREIHMLTPVCCLVQVGLGARKACAWVRMTRLAYTPRRARGFPYGARCAGRKVHPSGGPIERWLHPNGTEAAHNPTFAQATDSTMGKPGARRQESCPQLSHPRSSRIKDGSPFLPTSGFRYNGYRCMFTYGCNS